MLSFTNYKERSRYWSELLQLFWLRELGCKTAFCVVSQVCKESAKKRDFYSHLDLDASSIDTHFVYEVLTINNQELENYYKHFRVFLQSLNKKQFINFCSVNKYYLSLILRTVSNSPSLSALFATVQVFDTPDLSK